MDSSGISTHTPLTVTPIPATPAVISKTPFDLIDDARIGQIVSKLDFKSYLCFFSASRGLKARETGNTLQMRLAYELANRFPNSFAGQTFNDLNSQQLGALFRQQLDIPRCMLAKRYKKTSVTGRSEGTFSKLAAKGSLVAGVQGGIISLYEAASLKLKHAETRGSDQPRRHILAQRFVGSSIALGLYSKFGGPPLTVVDTANWQETLINRDLRSVHHLDIGHSNEESVVACGFSDHHIDATHKWGNYAGCFLDTRSKPGGELGFGNDKVNYCNNLKVSGWRILSAARNEKFDDAIYMWDRRRGNSFMEIVCSNLVIAQQFEVRDARLIASTAESSGLRTLTAFDLDRAVPSGGQRAPVASATLDTSPAYMELSDNILWSYGNEAQLSAYNWRTLDPLISLTYASRDRPVGAEPMFVNSLIVACGPRHKLYIAADTDIQCFDFWPEE